MVVRDDLLLVLDLDLELLTLGLVVAVLHLVVPDQGGGHHCARVVQHEVELFNFIVVGDEVVPVVVEPNGSGQLLELLKQVVALFRHQVELRADALVHHSAVRDDDVGGGTHGYDGGTHDGYGGGWWHPC